MSKLIQTIKVGRHSEHEEGISIESHIRVEYQLKMGRGNIISGNRNNSRIY